MSLSATSYVKQFYRGNLFGATSSGRSGRSNHDLVSADVSAIKRAVKELGNYDYKEGAGEELWNKVLAYVDTYNNFIGSAKESGNDSLDRYAQKLKKMTKEHADKLAEIGITIQGSGRLKADKTKLKETSRYKVSKVFSEDAEYSGEIDKYMTRIRRLVRKGVLIAPNKDDRKQTAGSTKAAAQAASEDAQLFQKLAEALGGGSVDYSI